MDVGRILENMPRDSRDACRQALENYKRTGDRRYADEVIAILQNFDDDSDVRELIRSLR